ncbi:MAG: DUF6370 family protein [Bacteroidota bacterium]|nr:DUF6370 family protein [Bacteroidota bacterium]
MKTLFTLVVCSFFILSAGAQNKSTQLNQPDSTKKIQTLDASCGECQFHLEGKGCNLAVRIEGKAYFVDGTSINDHGDAHAKDGFCEAIRKAEVQGELINNRFKVTYFKLVKPEPKKEVKLNAGD